MLVKRIAKKSHIMISNPFKKSLTINKTFNIMFQASSMKLQMTSTMCSSLEQSGFRIGRDKGRMLEVGRLTSGMLEVGRFMAGMLQGNLTSSRVESTSSLTGASTLIVAEAEMESPLSPKPTLTSALDRSEVAG